MSYIQRFTQFEMNYFWRTYPKPKTLCRMATFLQDREIVHNLSPSGVGEHAEVEALKKIKLKLKTELRKDSTPNDESAVFDLVVRLNNSPCYDKKCQKYIIDWIKDIQELIPKTSFRLILYFSNFYLEYQPFSPIGTVLKNQTQWIVDLVKQGVVVIFCPIVVSEMVLKPFYTNEVERTFDVDLITKNDQKLLRNFRTLLKKLEAKKLNIFKSENFEKEYKKIILSFFTNTPQHITVFPKGKKHLSKLPTEHSISRVDKRYHPYDTRNPNNRYN